MLSSWPNPQSVLCSASRSMAGRCRPQGLFLLRAPSPDLDACHALLDRKIQPQLSSSQPCLAIIVCCACSLIKTNTWPWMMLRFLVKVLLEKMSSHPSGSQHHITWLPTPWARPHRLGPPRLRRAKAVNYPGPLCPNLMLKSRAAHHIRENPKSKPR